MRWLFRPHRGGLSEAMAEVREFSTKQQFERFIEAEYGPLLAVEPYGWDDRIQWDTHIVMYRIPAGDLDSHYVAGFTNGPLSQLKDQCMKTIMSELRVSKIEITLDSASRADVTYRFENDLKDQTGLDQVFSIREFRVGTRTHTLLMQFEAMLSVAMEI